MFNIDPRTRVFQGSKVDSGISFDCSDKIFDVATIEFWLKLYTPEIPIEATIIEQVPNYYFVIDTINREMKFKSGVDPIFNIISSSVISSLDYWLHISLVNILTGTQSYIMVSDTDPVFSTMVDSVACTGKQLAIRVRPTSIGFKVGVKEFRIWNIYKSPDEIRGMR